MTFYAVHPADKDLHFLKKLNEDLVARYPESFNYLRLEANYQTHEACLATLRKDVNTTVFFFCHALEKSIRGCKIESAASSKDYKNFFYGNLISPTLNIDVFNGKKVFCLACFSSALGEYAVKAGAKVFLGFGDIPFFVTENFKEQLVIDQVKNSLRDIIYTQITDCIDHNKSFNQLSLQITVAIGQLQNALLLNKEAGLKLRTETYKVLSRIKNGITMFGNGNEPLLG